MRKLLTILIFAFCGCTKTELENHCQLCIELSDKFRQSDTVFLRTDTLYQGRLCDSTLGVFRREAAKDTVKYRLCGLNMIEQHRYIYKP